MSVILFVLGLPVLLALITAQPITERIPKSFNLAWLMSGTMALMAVLLLVQGYQPVIADQGAATYTLDWVPAYGLSLSFYLDSLSLLFGLIITGIGVVVFLYTGYYFEERPDRVRFLRLLSLFAAAMLWLVLSGNLITLFIAWELTSITSFLLIGFKGDKYESARAGATRALVVTGGGGLALLVGTLMLGTAAGTFEMAELLTLDMTDHPWYIAFTLLIMLSAFTKSAQFPFHFWLPGAMDAPTPASSFLHSATMVKAGVYLLARLHPTLGGADFWTDTLLLVGLTTFLYSSILAVRQPDLKGLLAFTTTAKLGALVALIGVPEGYGIKAALVGILAHALYKSALFLSVGSIDHATGTRQVSKLGGLWNYMPITGVVVIISALSMAGLPPFLGFVAKETLLEAFFDDGVLLAVVFVASVFTAAAGYILIWDIFFRKEPEAIHFHALPRPMETGPLLMVGGTIVFALFVTQIIRPLVEPIVPVEFKLVLFPGFNNVFWLSMAAIISGLALFFLRNPWRRVKELPFNATTVYNGFISGSEWIADQVLKTQNGKLRHYLIVIISVVMGILLYGGLARDLFALETLEFGEFTVTDIVDVMLLALAIIAAWISVRVHKHLHAALALAIFGYAVGGVFLVEPAPDVALVQFLVETLATVVLVIMISRVRIEHREEAMEVLKRPLNNGADAFAKIRDVSIALVTGVIMGAFALVALVNRDNRESIAEWHLDNAFEEVGVTDVVSAILTDFRGTDTLIEIAVFATAALGIFALLTINREQGGEPGDLAEALQKDSRVATPLIRVIATIVLPITLIIAAVHILYGANAPGDGFTAGVVSGLGIALYYVVFGYERVRERLRWLHPARTLVAGLFLALLNGLFPILVDGNFMGLVDFIPDIDFANLKATTTIIFEIGIAVTVFGSVSLIMETIARPSSVRPPREPYESETAATTPLAPADNQPVTSGD